MARFTRFLAILAALSYCVPCSAQPAQRCNGGAKLVGDCFTIHGRLSVYNGAPSYRIWKIGTNRILGIHEGIGESAWMPDEIRDQAGFGTEVFGDFEVCPLSKKKPGVMQIVCIKSASHVAVKHNKAAE
jgi:hypothetical protein